MSELEFAPPFITFYSFKGGVGRSMAAINVAGILASRGFRVLVIDMDLEAPGLSFLANAARADEPRATHQLGFVDFMLDAVRSGADADLFALPAAEAVARYSAPYELPEEFRRTPEGSLSIMPAGQLDEDYSRRLEQLDLPGLYRDGTGASLLQAFKQTVCDARLFDYVFIDSRTGFSDESGICTRDLADCLMVVSGLNRQNVEGTTRFLATLRRATDRAKPLEVVLSPIPTGEDALVDEREAQARTAFREAWGEEIQMEIQIPYHPQLALTEEPHIFRRRRGYLFDAYYKLERRLLELLGHTSDILLVQAREAYQAKNYELTIGLLRRAEALAEGREWANHFVLSVDFSDVGAASVFEHVIEKVDVHVRQATGDHLSYDADRRSMEGKLDDAEVLYQRALHASPDKPEIISDYAIHLWNRGDGLERVKEMFERALDVGGDTSSHIVGLYAVVLEHLKMDASESMFKEALSLDSTHSHTLANYGGFCLSAGRIDEGMAIVDRALTHLLPVQRGSNIEAECWMYTYCCGGVARYNTALAHLRKLVDRPRPVDTRNWDFAGVIEQARQLHHPEHIWLPVLADVLARRKLSTVLEAWPAWRELAKTDDSSSDET
jgi:cellulose biosynthesis protein BcsQ/tetratricopeptide (TPR) repeat protein